MKTDGLNDIADGIREHLDAKHRAREQALPLIKLETPREFYDYEAKYVANDTRYIIPCGLEADAERAVQRQVLAAFNTLGCSGWGRVDLLLDAAGQPWFIEVNTSPGMTDFEHRHAQICAKCDHLWAKRQIWRRYGHLPRSTQ